MSSNEATVLLLTLPIKRLASSPSLSSQITIGQLPSFPIAPAPDLVETVQEITMTEVMTEVVGLIPLLVGLVISFLGLRKGFRMLSQVLHKA